MKIGSAKYGGGKKTFKIKDGSNVYGILPPLGELADKGKWSVYYRVEWGYKDTTGKLRPFQDVRVVNRKTQMVEVESAAHLYREQLKSNKTQLVELFKIGQATQEQVKEATNLVKQFNLDCKHYLNVITPTGEIGLLKLGHRGKVALDAAIQSLRDKGIEPIGLTGIYFDIDRFIPEGRALDTTYTVTPYAENVQAEVGGQIVTVQQRKTYQLTDSIINRLADEAFELHKLYPVVTAEDVQRFVTEGAVAVEQVLSSSDDSTTPIAQPVQQPVNAPIAQPTVVNAPIAQPTVVNAPIAQPVVEPTPAPTVKSEPVVTQPVVEPTPVVTQNTPVTPDTMSDDDFLRSIGAV